MVEDSGVGTTDLDPYGVWCWNKVEAGDVNMDEWSGLCVPTLTVHLQWVHRRGKVPDFHLSPEALHGGLVVVGFAPEVRGGFWDVNDFIFKIAPMFVEKYVCEVLACSYFILVSMASCSYPHFLDREAEVIRTRLKHPDEEILRRRIYSRMQTNLRGCSGDNSVSRNISSLM